MTQIVLDIAPLLKELENPLALECIVKHFPQLVGDNAFAFLGGLGLEITEKASSSASGTGDHVIVLGICIRPNIH